MIPELAECIILPTGERVCIIKTIWLKLIQRKWKYIYKKRMEVWNKRKSVKALIFREINGKWPNACNYYPNLKGMLV